MFARIAARAWAPAIGTAGTLIAAAAWLSKATDGDARALAQNAETSFNSRVRLALNEYRAKEQEMRTRWERDEEERWRFLPARAWPADQPDAAAVPGIAQDLAATDCISVRADKPETIDSNTVSVKQSPQCASTAFNFATALVFNNLDPARGLRIYRKLAEASHVDGMVAAGVVLLEGLGVPADEREGVRWLRKACEQKSAQAYYEMGTAYYTGIQG